MKIIDFEKKGNLVRFYLGDNDCNDFWGDDWDDAPYEHNAGTVYSNFVKGFRDVVFPIDYSVFEPSDDWHYHGNSPFCKDDFVKRNTPCVVAIKEDPNEWIEHSYSGYVGSDNAVRFYYGDHLEPGDIVVYDPDTWFVCSNDV